MFINLLIFMTVIVSLFAFKLFLEKSKTRDDFHLPGYNDDKFKANGNKPITDDSSNEDDDKSKDDSSNKDDDTKDDSSSKSKVKEALSEAKEAVAQTAKEAKEAASTAKNIISQIFAVLSSMFWWSVLFGVVYLILEFGISIYQGASEFMSDSSTPTSTPIPLNRIVDGDYVPDKTDGTYLFTIDANKTYRIKVSGCNLRIRVDGARYNTSPYTVGGCSDGKDTAYMKKWKITSFHKKVISTNAYWGMAILVVKKKKKIIKKLPIGGNLYRLNGAEFPNNAKLYLYVNLSVHENVESGEWHVVVDEI